MLAGMEWTSGAPWQVGSQALLEVAQPAFKLKTTMKEATPPHRIVWTGTVMGVNFESEFVFSPQTDGTKLDGTTPDATTLMQAVINLSGAAVFFISDDMKKKGMAAFVPWFEGLKTQAEKLAQGR